ncbi:class A beta-lactamase, subclass A2 [Myroides profundi]|uniref:beta-lactamase n=1 Tax=Myroides profundi TaxID=480520 RepID=A0AAJ5BCY9_MYRPR|nr:class A beta-lactamase, subclass A2 [Myroides profundi]AJH14910.1 beta-lactamase class A [Myroides profundi]SEQ27755.1 beta-lactamase class A [Myroides profundi]
MKSFILTVASLISTISFGQHQELNNQINKVINTKNATVGVAIIYDAKDTLTVNNNHKYPTMSVYKFFQALNILDYMDKHNISLDTEIFIKKEDLQEGTYSPLRDKRPMGDFNISLGELIQYAASHSDNNVSNLFFKSLIGPKMTDLYFRTLGIKEFEIVSSEEEMSLDFNNQYQNWITPLEATRILEMFRKEELLSPKYNNFLRQAMIDTKSGQDKVKALLPKNTLVVHKTGMSFRNKEGLRAADNDLAIVYLPNGKQFSIAVLVMDSKESDQTNAAIIAEIAKLTYDYFSKR